MALTSQQSTASTTSPPLRVLLVDDNADLVLALMLILGSRGYDVHGLYDPFEVLPLVQRVRPNVIVLDLAMPGKSGYVLAAELRAHYGTKPVLIAMSGEFYSKADVLACAQAGFAHHCRKPCDPHHLLALLEAYASPRFKLASPRGFEPRLPP